MLIISQLKAQVNEPKRFYSNVVKIGSHDFGFITGQDKDNYYFICIRPLTFNSDAPINTVHFYLSKFTTTANRIKNFRLGSSYTVALYQCKRDVGNHWQDKFYGSDNRTAFQLSTFVGDNVEDSLWSIDRESIIINELSNPDLIKIKVPANSDVEMGMPIITDYGSIFAIFAERGNQKTLIDAIDMNSIADQIFRYDPGCKYLNMIQYGKTDTRCNTNSKIVVEEDNPSKESRTYKFINFGIFGNLMGGFPQHNVMNEGKGGTLMYNYGVSLYFNIDPMNYKRLTVKIGTGAFSESFDNGIWKSSDDAVTQTGSDYKFINIPIVYEFEVYHSSNTSGSFGIGYSPYFTFKQSIDIKNNSSGTTYLYKVDQSGMTHRIIAELHFVEWENIRIGLNGARDLTPFPNNNYKLNFQNVAYKPYESRKGTWYVGLELSVRFTGNWGLRKD